MMKKKILTIVVLLVIIISFYFNNYRIVRDPSQMPDIVFLNIIDYTEVSSEHTYAMTFYDKNGVHYTSKEPYSLGFDFEKLVSDYREGKLDDQIEYHMTCDVDELFENYKKLCKVSRNKWLKIIYPEEGPQVQAIETTYYGLYYDRFGNVKSVVLHKEDESGDLNTNDKTANEIYDWYIGTFQKK